jgi:nitric oxide reductase subunit B
MLQSDILVTLRWVRTIGDVVFIIGALAVSWQVVKGVFGFDHRTPKPAPVGLSEGAIEANSAVIHGADYCCGSCSDVTSK